MFAGQAAGAVMERQRQQLSEEFPGWRIGRGGSGRWWAVLGSVLVRATSPEELRMQLYAVADEQPRRC